MFAAKFGASSRKGRQADTTLGASSRKVVSACRENHCITPLGGGNSNESQAYTSLMQIGANEAYVVYNKHYAPSHGSGAIRPRRACPTGFGMNTTVQ